MTSSLNPKFSFETFVVGAANRLAVTAGRAVAENPGTAYNPLFIYSGSGLGKTHLLMALGQGAKKLLPHLNIEYLTLDEYVEAFHAAVAAGQGDAFRRRFQNVDMLLVDDVQFLTNRKEMQAELLRLTEALQTAGHQIVLTSDRPPAEIADLDERLISRFSGGLVVDIGAPDYETRVAILRRKAEERRAKFQPGVLETVAAAEFQNVRELMGALNRLVAYQAVNDVPLNAEGAKQLLGLSGGAAARALDPGAAGQSLFRDPDRLADAEAAAERVRAGAAPPPGPSGAFPLAAYAVGRSNEVAVSAARAVIEQPGKRYNPLVLTGKSGLGKTHLLNAIGLELAKAQGAIVACLSTQAFIDELIAAIDGNRMDWWHARYRQATALLLDGVHLMGGRGRTQEELFNLFNLFQDDERQLVFTPPQHPHKGTRLEPRLTSRLEGGLVAELAEPDRTVRRTVLERLLAQQQVVADAALLDYIADRPVDSVRALIGVVQRVIGAAAAQDQPVTAGVGRGVLEGQSAEQGRRTGGVRTRGLVVSSLGGIRSREKMAWDWPDPVDRIVEELR